MDNQFLDNIRVATSEAIKKAKSEIPMYTGISLENKQFETGRITVLWHGEVLYTIKKEKPEDLIKGHKKSDIENVYSSAYGWRD